MAPDPGKLQLGVEKPAYINRVLEFAPVGWGEMRGSTRASLPERPPGPASAVSQPNQQLTASGREHETIGSLENERAHLVAPDEGCGRAA